MAHVEHITQVRRVPDVEGERVDRVAEVGPSVILARIVYFITGVIIAFIVLRFILLLLGANSGNAFVDFIYSVSGALVAPFYGIFNNTPKFGASMIDVSSLVAIIVYALIGWALVSLVTLGSRNRTEV